MSIRGIIFGGFEEEILQALRENKYELEKVYADVDWIELNMSFPIMGLATLIYNEDGKTKTAREFIHVLLITHEGSTTSPETLIGVSSKVVRINNPNSRRYIMRAEVKTMLRSRVIEVSIRDRI
jgi:hypothetical protein